MPGWGEEWSQQASATGPTATQTQAQLTSLAGYNVSPWSYEGVMPTWAESFSSGPADATWQAINRILLFPVVLPSALTVVQSYVVNGAAVSGNSDIGVYDSSGTRLAHTGSFSNVTAGIAGLTLTALSFTFSANTLYYLSIGCDNTTQRFRGLQPSSFSGSLQVYAASAGAFPLPATVTLTVPTVTTDIAPEFGLTSLAVV